MTMKKRKRNICYYIEQTLGMTLWVFCGMGGMYLIGMAYKVCEKECGERVTHSLLVAVLIIAVICFLTIWKEENRKR
jgi:hypothetical protein